MLNLAVLNIKSILSGDDREAQMRLFRRVLSILLGLLFLMRGWQGEWLSQLEQPVLVSPEADNFYWLLHLSGLVDRVAQSYWVCLSIDLGILGLTLVLVIFPEKFWAGRALLLWSVLYFVCFNSWATHHEHIMVGFLLGALFLAFKKGKNADLLQWSIRYYACFMMGSAGLWKIYRGTAWVSGHMQKVLEIQHAELLIKDRDGLYTGMIQFLISNGFWADMLWYGALLLELSFWLGFFSFKADRWLMLALLFFVVADYLLMGLAFWPLGLLALFFIPVFQPKQF